MLIVIRTCTQGLLRLIPSRLNVSHRLQICKQISLLIGVSSRSMFSRFQIMQSMENTDWTNTVTMHNNSKLSSSSLKALVSTERASIAKGCAWQCGSAPHGQTPSAALRWPLAACQTAPLQRCYNVTHPLLQWRRLAAISCRCCQSLLRNHHV